MNRPDVLQRLGKYPVPHGASDLPGLEIAGTIESGDAEAMRTAGFSIGDRVCALVSGGGYAEYCASRRSASALPSPSNLTAIEAAKPARDLLHRLVERLRAGTSAAARDAARPGRQQRIGVTAIQLAKAHGAKVIVTVGSDDKAAACLALGADHAINYKTQDFVAEVQRITAKAGVDVVLDMVAGDYVAREIGCLAEEGRIAIIAVQGGVDARFDAGLLLRRRLTSHRFEPCVPGRSHSRARLPQP